MKIFIIGISGSGKTYLAKILSEKHNIESYDLDNIFGEKKYSKKKSAFECENTLIEKVKNQKNGIYEGIYTEGTTELAKEADLIIGLNLNKNILSGRIFKRGLKRRKKTGENFLEMLSLVKFQRDYKKVRKGKKESFLAAHQSFVGKYKDKTIILKSLKELKSFLKGK